MSIFSNILGHGKSTLVGLLTALGAAAAAGVTGAATQFGQQPQTTDWKPYAAAAVAAAVPAIVGAFATDPPPPPTYSQQAQLVAVAIDQASKEYAAQKANQVIKDLQKQLGQAD